MIRYLLSILLLPAVALAVRAFPGAEGHGSDTRGGLDTSCGVGDPTVYYITSTAAAGSGTLAECVNASGKRLCVFETSGELELNGTLEITNPCISIFGQTAPSPGFHAYDTTLAIKTNDVVVQHLRFRRGDTTDNRDTIQFFGATDAIVDHVTAAWATDETLSVVGGSSRITVSNSIIAEALDNGYGSKQCIVNSNDTESNQNITFHHNAFILGKTRNCKMRQKFTAEFAMNTWYGIGPASTKANLLDLQADVAGQSANMRLDFWSNTIVQGPGSGVTALLSDCTAAKCPPTGALIYVGAGASTYNDLWGGGGLWGTLFDGSLPSGTYQSGSALVSSGLTAQTAAEAYADIVTNGDVGARPLDRAAQDTAWIANVVNQTAQVGTTTYTMSSTCAPNCNVFGTGTNSVWPDCVEAGDCSDYAVSARPTFAVNLRTLTDLKAVSDPWGAGSSGFTNYEEALHSTYTDAVEDNSGDPSPGDGGGGGTPPDAPANDGADFPTFAESGGSETSNVQAHSIALPATIAANELIIIVFGMDDGGGTGATWDNSTAGMWTALRADQTGAAALYIYYKITDGTEDGATLSISTTNFEKSVYRLYHFTDWHGTTPPEISTVATGTSTAPNAGSVTASWGDEKNLFISVFGMDTTSDGTVSGFPSGYSNTGSTFATGSGAVVIGYATKESESATDDAGAFTTVESDDWIADTIVVRPAVYVGVPTVEASGSTVKLRKGCKKKGGLSSW